MTEKYDEKELSHTATRILAAHGTDGTARVL
jgi:hypothetical protein